MRVRKIQMGGEMPQEEMMDPRYGTQGMDPGMEEGGRRNGRFSQKNKLMMMAEEIVGQLGPEAAYDVSEAIATNRRQGGGGGGRA